VYFDRFVFYTLVCWLSCGVQAMCTVSVESSVDVWEEMDQRQIYGFLLPPLNEDLLVLARKHFDHQRHYDGAMRDAIHRCFLRYWSAYNVDGMGFLMLAQNLLVKGAPPLKRVDGMGGLDFMKALFFWVKKSFDPHKNLFLGRYTCAEMNISCPKKYISMRSMPVDLNNMADSATSFKACIKQICAVAPLLQKDGFVVPSDVSSNGVRRDIRCISWMVFLCDHYSMQEAKGVRVPSIGYDRFREALDCNILMQKCLRVSVGPKLLRFVWDKMAMVGEQLDDTLMALQKQIPCARFQDQLILQVLADFARTYPMELRHLQIEPLLSWFSLRNLLLCNMDDFETFLCRRYIGKTAEDVLCQDYPQMKYCPPDYAENSPLADEWKEYAVQQTSYQGVYVPIIHEVTSIRCALATRGEAYARVYWRLAQTFYGKDLPLPPLHYVGVRLTKNMVQHHCCTLYAHTPAAERMSRATMVVLGLCNEEVDEIVCDPAPCAGVDMTALQRLKDQFKRTELMNMRWMWERLHFQERKFFIYCWRNFCQSVYDFYYATVGKGNTMQVVPYSVDTAKRAKMRV